MDNGPGVPYRTAIRTSEMMCLFELCYKTPSIILILFQRRKYLEIKSAVFELVAPILILPELKCEGKFILEKRITKLFSITLCHAVQFRDS